MTDDDFSLLKSEIESVMDHHIDDLLDHRQTWDCTFYFSSTVDVLAGFNSGIWNTGNLCGAHHLAMKREMIHLI